MRIIELNPQNKTNLLDSLLKRSPDSYGEYEETVNEIIRQVREKGDEALFEYTQKIFLMLLDFREWGILLGENLLENVTVVWCE